MSAPDVNLQNDSVAAEIARRARDEEEALDRAVRRSLETTSDDSDIFGSNEPDEPTVGSPSVGETPGVAPKDPEGRPLIGWDVLSAPFLGAARGVAESGDTIGDLVGADFDLSGELPEHESVAGEVVGTIAQFALPFGAAFKGLKMVNFMQKGWRASAGAGMIADFAAFDPDEGRLSDLINEQFPSLQNPLTEYLATQEDDTALEGRMKNAVEGLALGGVGEALMRSFRGTKNLKGAIDELNTVSPDDFAKIDPTFRTDLFAQAEAVKVARERVDILMSARESLMALDEADPSFLAARQYLSAKAAGAGDLPKIGDEVMALVADAEFRASSYGDDAIEALNSRAAAARELSPLAALEADDPNLARTVRDLIDDQDKLGALSNTSELSSFIADETERLKAALVEWERVRTDARWDDLAPGIQKSIDEGVTANRRAPDSGFRFLQIERDSDDRIRSVLEGQGRTNSAPGQLRIIDDGSARTVRPTPREFSGDPGTLPPVEDGLVRLYRASSPTVKFQDVFDVEGLNKAGLGPGSRDGHFYSDSFDVADYYRETYGRDATVSYLDVPRSALDELRVRESEFVVPRNFSYHTAPGQRAGVAEPRRVSRTRNVLGGAARLDPEQLTRLNRAVQESDVSGVGQILAEGTNLNYVLADDQRVQNLYAELGRMYKDAGKGTKRSLEETRQRADELMADMGRAADEDPGQLDRFLEDVMPGSDLPSDVKITALRTMEAMTMQRTMELTEHVLNGASNARTVAEMMQASQAALRLNDARRFLSADLARGLNAHKIPVMGEGSLPPQSIMEIIREGGDPTFIAKRMRAAVQGGPDAMTSLRKELENPKMKALSGYWYASLLSGPITHMVNMGSNAGIAVLRPMEDIAGGLVDGAFRGDFQRAQEGVEALHDLVRSLRGSFKAAAIAFDVGESQLGKAITPFDAPELASRGPLHALTEGKNGPLYSMTRAFSTALGVPGRLLVAEDEMFRGVNYFVHARRAARRHLRQTQPNMKGADFEIQLEQLTQDARHWSEFSNRLSVEKRAQLRSIHEGALNEARYNTFTNDLEHGIGKSLQTFQHNHPWFRLIMPFVRTPTNIFRFAMQRVPAMGLLQRQNRELMQAAASGNRDAMRDLAGRQMIGLAATMVTADMFAKGVITGAGPKDPAQREQWLTTHQPYSVRIGDEWIEYRRLEPVGMQVGLVADALTSFNELESDDQLDAGGVMAGTAMSVISNLSSKRYLQGVTQFLGMVSSGEPDAAKRYMLSQAGNLVPLAQLNAQTNRALVDPQLREIQTVGDALYAKIPGLSESVTPRTNMWGEAINLPPGYRYDTLAPHHNGNITLLNGFGSLILPAKNRSVHSTPTRDWLTEIGFSLGNPIRSYFGRMRDVKLTPEQRNRWIELTNNARGSRTSMEAEIERLRLDPRSRELTDQANVDLVRKVIRQRKFRAERQMMKEFPELRAKALEKRVQRQIRTRNDEERAAELSGSLRSQLLDTL